MPCLVTAIFALCSVNLLIPHSLISAHEAITPMPRDRDGWYERFAWISRQSENNPNAQLIFIGDSITERWEEAGRDIWLKHYARLNAINAGISGDCTQHVLWRLQQGNLGNINPKVAVVLIGTNNSHDNTPQEIAEGVGSIIATLQTRLPNTKILLLGIFPSGFNAGNPQRRIAMKANTLISKLADNHTIYYLDIGSALTEPNGNISPKIMPDSLHLSTEGYAIWASEMAPTLQSLLE